MSDVQLYTPGTLDALDRLVRSRGIIRLNEHAMGSVSLSQGEYEGLLATAKQGVEATENYDLLRRAINEFDVDGCTRECSSYGHADECSSSDPRAIIENQQREIDELRAAAVERGVRGVGQPEHASGPDEELAKGTPETRLAERGVRDTTDVDEARRRAYADGFLDGTEYDGPVAYEPQRAIAEAKANKYAELRSGAARSGRRDTEKA